MGCCIESGTSRGTREDHQGRCGGSSLLVPSLGGALFPGPTLDNENPEPMTVEGATDRRSPRSNAAMAVLNGARTAVELRLERASRAPLRQLGVLHGVWASGYARSSARDQPTKGPRHAL